MNQPPQQPEPEPVQRLHVRLWEATNDALCLSPDLSGEPITPEEAALLGVQLWRLLRALSRRSVYPIDKHGVIFYTHHQPQEN